MAVAAAAARARTTRHLRRHLRFPLRAALPAATRECCGMSVPFEVVGGATFYRNCKVWAIPHRNRARKLRPTSVVRACRPVGPLSPLAKEMARSKLHVYDHLRFLKFKTNFFFLLDHK